MNFLDYSRKRLRLDRELRSESKILAYGFDVFRHAGAMAFFVLLSDLTPWSVSADWTPWQTMSFVLVWSIIMAVVNLFRPSFVDASLEKTDRDAAA